MDYFFFSYVLAGLKRFVQFGTVTKTTKQPLSITTMTFAKNVEAFFKTRKVIVVTA